MVLYGALCEHPVRTGWAANQSSGKETASSAHLANEALPIGVLGRVWQVAECGPTCSLRKQGPECSKSHGAAKRAAQAVVQLSIDCNMSAS
jgi:hypothetical protein